MEYVFLIGVAGGVPHYTDYTRHVRLGDVVASVPPNVNETKPFIYVHSEKNLSPTDKNQSLSNNTQLSAESFTHQFWCPPNLELQIIAQNLWQKALNNPSLRTWEKFIEEGLATLEGQSAEFARPSANTDKLFMSIGPKDVIEMNHPLPSENSYDPRSSGMPMVHFGAIGSGRMVIKNEQVRQDIAAQLGILAFDSEFDSVAESIYGNRKDRYMFVRGIADYKDGSRKKEWQPFASLTAAAFMKAVICALPPMD